MKKSCFFLFFLILAVFSGCGNRPESRAARVENGLMTGISSPGAPQRTLNILERMAYYHVPGVSLAVINKGKMEWAEGYGILEAGTARKVTSETLFQTGSVGKVIAVMTTLSLVHKGRLELDEDVRRYLKSWKIPDNEFSRDTPITLRQLLSHTAGVGQDNSPPFRLGSPLPSLTEHLRSQNYEIIKPPGEGYYYSGAGFIIIEQIIEDVMKRPYSDVAADEVLKPLGMNNTFLKLTLDDSLLGRAALAHHKDGSLYANKYPVFPCFAPGTCNWSTPSDLALLFIELLRSYRGESSRVLPPPLTRIMMTSLTPSYGLGFKVIEEPGGVFVGHSGDFYGFHACVYGFRDTGQGVAIMTNGDNGVILYNEIIRSVAGNYGWPGCLPEKAGIEADPRQIENLYGSYFLSGRLELMNVYLKNGSLCCDLLGHTGTKLVPITLTRYYDPANDGVIIFGPAADGKTRDIEFRRIGVLLKGTLWPGFNLLYSDRFQEGVEKILPRKSEFAPKKHYTYVFNDIGYTLLEEKKFQNAVAVFQMALSIYPDSADLHDSLGEAYWKSGNKPLAIKCYRKALDLNPRLASARAAMDELLK